MFEGLPGNQSLYDIENVPALPHGPLTGKDILYLGSSITRGYGSLDVSYADYIAARNGTAFYKEAISGTCLVDDSPESYVSRLHTVDVNRRFDLFVCQLSTNDFSKFKPVGAVDDTDPSTVCGAINHIVAYVRKTWGCPVVFYSSHRFEGAAERYREMIDDLLKIAERDHFDVINLYDDDDFNRITAKQRALFMADNMHPTKAGYLLWWTPVFESRLCAALAK